MRNKSFIGGSVAMILVFLVVASTAQSQMLQRGMAQQGAQATVQENIVTLTGTVTAVNLATGQGMPSITLQENVLGSVTVLVGPTRVLAESKFEIKPAQVLQVKAFPDPRLPTLMLRWRSGTTRAPLRSCEARQECLSIAVEPGACVVPAPWGGG